MNYTNCWCETNDKEKTKSIKDAEARISELTTKIEAKLLSVNPVFFSWIF